MRIVTLTLHPAIDRIVHVDELSPGDTFSGRLAMAVPSGKGVNTARSLSSLDTGAKIIAAAWLGNSERGWFEKRLAESKITPALCLRDTATRLNHTLLEKNGRETHIKESMAPVSEAEQRKFLLFWEKTLRGGDLVILCGSAPEKTSARTLRSIFEIACHKAALVFADTNGIALEIAGAAALDGLKGNAAEFGEWLKLGAPLNIAKASHLSVLKKAFSRNGGPAQLLMTIGAAGALLIMPDKIMHAPAPRLPTKLGQAATGCGDAASAGWISAIARKKTPEQCLQFAVACGSAKFASLDPGCLNEKLANRLLRKIVVKEVKQQVQQH